MSLPIINLNDTNAVDLQPWVLLRQLSNAEVEASLWSIAEVGMALSIFSTRERAETYRMQILPSSSNTLHADWMSIQPREVEFGKLLVAHYRAGVKWIVLDPAERDAKRVFSIAEVLKALRDKLTTQS